MRRQVSILKVSVGRAIAGFVAMAIVGGSPVVAQTTAEKVVANGETVRIQEYPGTIGVGQEVLWVAADKGFCAAHGIKCELVKIATGSLGLQALTSGSIEFNYVTADLDVQAAARGVDIQIVVGTRPTLYLTLNARNDIPLPNLAKGYPAAMQDLKGRKVGVAARGAATEIQMRALLEGAGMSAADVTFVAVGAPGSAYSAFAAKTIDAAMSWPPFSSVCEANKNCVHLVQLSHQGPPVLQQLNGAVQVLAANRSYIKANPKVVRALIQAIEESVAWIRNPANFDEFVRISKAHFSLGDVPNADAVLTEILRDEQKNVAATVDPKALQATADYLFRFKVIDKKVDTSKLLYQHAPKPQ